MTVLSTLLISSGVLGAVLAELTPSGEMIAPEMRRSSVEFRWDVKGQCEDRNNDQFSGLNPACNYAGTCDGGYCKCCDSESSGISASVGGGAFGFSVAVTAGCPNWTRGQFVHTADGPCMGQMKYLGMKMSYHIPKDIIKQEEYQFRCQKGRNGKYDIRLRNGDKVADHLALIMEEKGYTGAFVGAECRRCSEAAPCKTENPHNEFSGRGRATHTDGFMIGFATDYNTFYDLDCVDPIDPIPSLSKLTINQCFQNRDSGLAASKAMKKTLPTDAAGLSAFASGGSEALAKSLGLPNFFDGVSYREVSMDPSGLNQYNEDQSVTNECKLKPNRRPCFENCCDEKPECVWVAAKNECTPATKVAYKKEGEDCGSCYCPPTYDAGTCAPGLECVHNEWLVDLPGKCRKPGSSAPKCICPNGELSIFGCTTTGAENCVTCKAGYELVGKSCKPKNGVSHQGTKFWLAKGGEASCGQGAVTATRAECEAVADRFAGAATKFMDSEDDWVLEPKGFCTGARRHIETEDECKEAFAALKAAEKMEGQFTYSINWSGGPKGCYRKSNGQVYFNIAGTSVDSADRRNICAGHVDVVIGSSSTVNKAVDTVYTDLRCPGIVTNDNWLTDDLYMDVFKVEVDDGAIYVKRADKSLGWGMNLQFRCLLGHRTNLQVGGSSQCGVGGWSQVPSGCSVQSGGDYAPHYRTSTPAGCNKIHSAYQLVCKATALRRLEAPGL